MTELNDIAPDFTLIDTTKTPHTLSEYRGKKVVLAFYPGAFTGVCTAEMCRFQDSMARLNDANAVVLGISGDSPFANGAFAQQNALTMPLLSDFGGKVVAKYGLTFHGFAGIPEYTASERAVLVLDEAGVVIYKWVGPNPGHEPDYDAVLAVL